MRTDCAVNKPAKSSGTSRQRWYSAERMSSEPAEDLAAALNADAGGFNRAMGLVFLRASPDAVAAELEVGPQHLQAYGIVHGGVYSGIIETVCSVGAALHAAQNGSAVVGLENHTSFLHACRSGRLRVEATPLSRGRRSQVWEGTVLDDNGRRVATGRVRLICLDGDGELAGEKIRIRQAGG
jgi:1,4-dihydroxy-2-naphthoyl-CoA hydrolase